METVFGLVTVAGDAAETEKVDYGVADSIDKKILPKIQPKVNFEKDACINYYEMIPTF